MEGKGHREPLIHHFQERRHGVRFDMTPHGHKKADGETGQQLLIVSDTKIPLEYDTKKLYIHLRKPSVDEMSNAEIIELTSSQPFSLEEEVEDIEPARVNLEKVFSWVSLKDWRKRLGFAPDEIIKKTLEATTQYCLVPEEENREMPRRHYKSRFPFLREKRLNDEVHSDTFFPNIVTAQRHTCSQIFYGKNTGIRWVVPMRKESDSLMALQDFCRMWGIPHTLKTDNAKTEVGIKWTDYCRKYLIEQHFTEPHSPWQNLSENAVNDISLRVKRCHRQLNIPYEQHHWVQKWCVFITNNVATKKLGWRTPMEAATGETPDISMFHFYVWQEIEYLAYDDIKLPLGQMLPGRWLGFAWDHGDSMSYYIRTEPEAKEKPQIIVRSVVRARRNNIYGTKGLVSVRE